MLTSQGQSRGRGRGNLFFGSTLSRLGYWKRTDEDVTKQSDKIFGLDTERSKQNKDTFNSIRNEDLRKKRETLTEQQLAQWGTFTETNEQWPMDNTFRIQFSNKMGFLTKHVNEDFAAWIAQGHKSQCDLKAAVDLNLTDKGTRHFRKIGAEFDLKGQVHVNHPLDPTGDLKGQKFLKGGSLCWLPSHMNAQKHSYHRDRHGRWIAVRLSTRDSEIVIIFAYRVCQSSITGDNNYRGTRAEQSHPTRPSKCIRRQECISGRLGLISTIRTR